jgi:hypothetical protein
MRAISINQFTKPLVSQIATSIQGALLSMNASRGAMYVYPLFNLHELGLGNSEPFVDRIIRQFLKIGEAVAGRWIEMPRGVLLLQVVPGNPNSGAIYLYDRQQQTFYMLGFDGPDDNLTIEDFEQLVSEYGLLRYAEQPSLSRTSWQGPGSLPAEQPPPGP